jgi:hypothetical protein
MNRLLLIASIILVGCTGGHNTTVAVTHRVSIPSTNHYEVTVATIVRVPLPNTTPVEYSTDGTTFSRVNWGNETFGDKTFGWYELKLEKSSVWLRVLSDATSTNTTAEIVFITKE